MVSVVSHPSSTQQSSGDSFQQGSGDSSQNTGEPMDDIPTGQLSNDEDVCIDF